MNVLTSSTFVVVFCALAGPANPPALASPRAGVVQARTRTVYVSVIDKQGQPVTVLQAAEFEVKVAGKLRDVVNVEPAKMPLRIALLVADQGTGAFQLGLAKFMQRLLGRTEFALISVLVQLE